MKTHLYITRDIKSVKAVHFLKITLGPKSFGAEVFLF